MLFHSNNGYANAPHYYVIRTVHCMLCHDYNCLGYEATQIRKYKDFGIC